MDLYTICFFVICFLSRTSNFYETNTLKNGVGVFLKRYTY